MLEARKQYVAAFHAQVGQWVHLDLCPMSAVERFIRKGEMPRDESLSYLGARLTPDHVSQWLTWVIGLLDRYTDTYHLALLDDIKYPDHPLVKHIWQNFWVVKVSVRGESALFWETWEFDEQGRRREADRRVTEVEVIKAFVDIFTYSWKCLPAQMLIKDKEAVIAYLRDQGKELPASFCG